MSSTDHAPPTVQCQHPDCQTRGQEWEFTDGRYCSTAHKRAAEAECGPTCAYRDCETTLGDHSAVEGDYCSMACYRRETGAGLLGEIERRHELCFTCFRRRKDIERPPAQFMARRFVRSGTGWSREGEDAPWTVERWGQDLSREAVCGFATPTQHAEMGGYGLECRCGAIDGDLDEPAVRDLEDWADWLAETVAYLREVGAREDDLRADVVERAYERTADLEYAVGMGLTWGRE
jgi:ribosomal protein S18 acetylase RimI-like enzyme